MALPVPEKTWNHKVNQIRVTVGDYQVEHRTVMMTIKESLKALGWTVSGSSTGWSGGASAGMDGVDRWPGNFTGTNTSATVDTTTNNTIRIRTAAGYSFTQFTVRSGATTAKTDIVTDLNTGFAAAGLTLQASIVGTNQIMIADTTTLGYIGIDSTANGCTLSTPLGFPTSGFTTIDKIVPASAGSNHTWIVLKNTNISANFEICIDFSNGNPYILTIVVGLSGFSGGSVTARPTATTSLTTINNTSWLNNGNTATHIVHVMMSTDGQCTRVISGYNTIPTLWWLFDVPKNPVAGWANPSIFFTLTGNTATIMGWTQYQDTARVNFYAASLWGTMYMGCEGAGTTSAPEWTEFQKPNQLSGENHIFPIGLQSETTNLKGRHGQIYDLWVGNLTAAALGGYSDATYPADSSRQFWQCDDFIQVWPGYTTPPGPLPIMDW